MQFDSINVSGSLRVHYEKILYPYETVAVTSGQIKVGGALYEERVGIVERWARHYLEIYI